MRMKRKEYEHFKRLQRMMQEIPMYGNRKPPRCCADCQYYHPDWKYRSCLYVECPFGYKKYTVRRKPLPDAEETLREEQMDVE